VPRPTPRPEVRFNEQQAGKQSYLPPQSSNSGLSDLTGFHPINNDPFIQDPEQSENPWSERIKTAGFTALVFVLIGVIFQVYGLAVTVPDQGPRTFLGSTTTSLVIYKKTKEVISGNVMVVKVKTGEQTTTYFGAGSISGDQLTLGLEGKNITLRTQDIAGKGFFLVPIVGAIIKNIGALIN
jgi:preprotein translocase subunit Sss1